MSLLGISLYPHLQSEAVMKQQLNLAVTLGYSQVYTTIQSSQAWDCLLYTSPASDNQPGLHLKNYRTQKKKCRIPQRYSALIYPPLPFNEEIANDGYRFLKRPYTYSIFHS